MNKYNIGLPKAGTTIILNRKDRSLIVAGLIVLRDVLANDPSAKSKLKEVEVLLSRNYSNCPWCKKDFFRSALQRKFCSTVCRLADTRARHIAPKAGVPDLPGEEWKVIEESTGFYAVSNKGRVKSLDRWYVDKTGCKKLMRSKLLRPQKNHHRYFVVIYHDKMKFRKFHVGDLVAEYFLPNPHGFKHVGHLNGDSSMNDIANLYWRELSPNRRYGPLEAAG